MRLLASTAPSIPSALQIVLLCWSLAGAERKRLRPGDFLSSPFAAVRPAKSDRLKQAKADADKEVAAYKDEREATYKEKMASVRSVLDDRWPGQAIMTAVET